MHTRRSSLPAAPTTSRHTILGLGEWQAETTCEQYESLEYWTKELGGSTDDLRWAVTKSCYHDGQRDFLSRCFITAYRDVLRSGMPHRNLEYYYVPILLLD